MEIHVREIIKVEPAYPPSAVMCLKRIQWAGARILFISSLTIGITTVAGLYLFSPLFSFWFLGTIQFWKFARMAPRLVGYAYTRAYHFLRKDFSPSIPITTPPMRSPDLRLVRINPGWQPGDSCTNCGKCCRKIDCPLQEKETGHCLAYDSFFWRYFNCGRYPSSQKEIDHYECPKWVMRPAPKGTHG